MYIGVQIFLDWRAVAAKSRQRTERKRETQKKMKKKQQWRRLVPVTPNLLPAPLPNLPGNLRQRNKKPQGSLPPGNRRPSCLDPRGQERRERNWRVSKKRRHQLLRKGRGWCVSMGQSATRRTRSTRRLTTTPGWDCLLLCQACQQPVYWSLLRIVLGSTNVLVLQSQRYVTSLLY